MTSLIPIALTLLAGAVLVPLLIHRVYRAPRIPENGTPADLGLPYRQCEVLSLRHPYHL